MRIYLQFFFKENVRYPVWISRDPIFSYSRDRFEILGTRIGSLKRLKKTWCMFNVENELHSAFPNSEIALPVYFCLTVSSCTGESFSKLRRIKNYLRSSIWQEKQGMLSQMSREHEILRDTDLETIINDFVRKNAAS